MKTEFHNYNCIEPFKWNFQCDTCRNRRKTSTNDMWFCTYTK